MNSRKTGLVWNIPEQLFREYIEKSESWSDITRKCGYASVGNFTTIKKRIKELELDYSHLPIGQGKSNSNKSHSRHTLDEILIENSTYNNMTQLKKRLVKELKWEYKCSECELTNWMNKAITLDMDHINGVHSDNRIENLRLLCPNCHSQTNTFKGRNAKIKSEPIIYRCVNCNNPINSKKAKRCVPCYKLYRNSKV